MPEVYIVEGPIRIGNVFGFYGDDVPPGRYAVVMDGEYANGGHGPSAVTSELFRSEDEAALAATVLAADLGADYGPDYTFPGPRVVRPLTPAAEARPPA